MAEHTLGKGEVESSILSHSTILPDRHTGSFFIFLRRLNTTTLRRNFVKMTGYTAPMVVANIQALRAIAALAVVFFHLPTFGYESPLPDPLHGNLVELGASGVDVFFVISGFIMSLSFDRRPVTAADFARNRAVRIIPIYWCITLLWWLWLVATSEYFRDAHMSVGHLLASLFFVAQPMGYAEPFIQPGWTLEYEALFYLIFACFAASAYRNVLIVGTLIAAAFLLGGHFIMLEFGLGMLAYHLYKAGMSERSGVIVFGTGIVVLVMTSVLGFNLSFEDSLTSWRRLMTWGLPAFLIVLGAASMPAVPSKGLALLGDASYSIYVSHAVTIIALSGVISSTFMHPLAAQAVCYTACVVFGILTYRWLEKPLTAALKPTRLPAGVTS